MAEWLMALVLKTSISVSGIEGSNPSASVVFIIVERGYV